MTGTMMRQRLLASTIFAGAVAALATPAFAQPTQEAPVAPAVSNPAAPPPSIAPAGSTSGDSAQGEIVVTGSRIPHPNLEAASPIAIVGAQEIKQTGTTRVEDLLNQLPQVFADQGGNISNGATGTAELNLRDLGTNRTLVLVNGRRLVPGDPASSDSAADINFIPAQLIKHVDVLTGGASSAYGADAVAGVVNFVLDTDFTGFKLDGQYSFYNHQNGTAQPVIDALNAKGYGYPQGMTTDGGTVDVTGVFGAGFDDNRGHVTAYFSYRKVDAVLEGRRDYSACALSAKATTGFSCGGSGTAFPANIYKVSNGQYYHVSGNQLVPGQVLYNYAPLNYFQRPDERYTAGFFAHYDVSDAFKPYMEFMFMSDRSVAQIAGSGDFFNTNTINCDNPLLSAQEVSVVCSNGNLVGQMPDGKGGYTAPTIFQGAEGNYTKAMAYVARRNVEGGGRDDDLEHTSYRGVVGMKGDIVKGVSYDAYYQYSRTSFSETQANYFSISRLQNALDAIVGPDGTPVCRVGGACVPYNPFQAGGVTQAQLNYLEIPAFSSGTNTEQVADASVTFKGDDYGLASPFAHEGLGVNVGFEFRKETNEQGYDVSFSSGDLAGLGGGRVPVSGQFSVKEGFIETSLPLVQDRPFFEQLVLNGGYRRSRYEIGSGQSTFSTDTYKGELIWAPLRDIKLRGSYNRAVRAPNIGELFSAANVVLDGTTDPCALSPGQTTPTASLAACELTGLTAAQYGVLKADPANQYYGQTGGNLNLKPEIADSFTGGVVLTPTFLRGFSATADFFDIRVKNDIDVIGFNTIITQCLDTGSAAYCGLIHRNSNTGSLSRGTPQGYITDTLLNAGTLKTRGVDVTAAYTQQLGKWGSVGVSGTGTYLDKLTTIRPAISYDCAGLYGAQCGTPAPRWRHRIRWTYTTPIGPSVSLQWRYFSKVRNEGTTDQPALSAADNGSEVSGTYPGNARIDAQSYFDLAFTVPVGDKFTFRIGANNLLDKDPPIDAEALAVFENGNTFAQTYDALGRYIYAGITINL